MLKSLAFLIALKLRNPRYVFMLRGSHENAIKRDQKKLRDSTTSSATTTSGTLSTCLSKYRWKCSTAVFCCYGGPSLLLEQIDQITIKSRGLLCDLRWFDLSVAYSAMRRSTSIDELFFERVVRSYHPRRSWMDTSGTSGHHLLSAPSNSHPLYGLDEHRQEASALFGVHC